MGLFSLAAKTVKELIEIGYPESVAKKIADGTLPMDAESVARRADEQGYGDVLYRGHHKDMPPTSDQDMWMSGSENVAETYARNRENGAVTPLRTNASNLADVNARGRGWRHVRTTSRTVPGIETGVHQGTDTIAEVVKDSGQYGGTLFRDIKDEAVRSRGAEKANAYNILGSRPDVKIRHADAAYDPKYTGPNIMGGAALPVAAGLLAAGQSDDADAGFVTRGGKTLLEAWHGSPHKFDKFSMDQIGTGEGAQAYGHGLYFADEIDVAKGYQPRDRANEQWMYEQYKAAEESGDQYMMDAWERAMMHDSPIELRASAADPDYDEYSQAAFAEVADALSANPGTGSLTRAEIDVTPESLLDWDKPLSEQSEAVRNAVQDIASNGDARFSDKQIEVLNDYLQSSPDLASGGTINGILGDSIYGSGDKSLVSAALSDRGIKGIKYLDGDSRAVGDGTSNYVIFDDGLINIAERGNADPRLLAGTAAGTAGLLAAPMLADKDKPLPVPTWGDVGESLSTILGMPMAGLQGLARGGYGLLTGEGFTEAAAQAGNTMDVGWKNGLLDVSGVNPDKGADQAEAYVTEKTGDESLGWMVKMGLLLGGI